MCLHNFFPISLFELLSLHQQSNKYCFSNIICSPKSVLQACNFLIYAQGIPFFLSSSSSSHTHLIHKHRRKAQKHNRLNSVFISRLRKYCFRHFSFGTISFFTGLKKTTRFSLLCVHDLRDYITFDSIMFSHHRPLRNNFINAFWTI